MIDPLDNPAPLVRRVYAYAAYRLGDGPEAEDVTSETFERALRYRESYDAKKGPPAAWLIGIARRCADDHLRGRAIEAPSGNDDVLGPGEEPGPAEASELRLDLAAAMAQLSTRDRELVALRYGGDLKVKDIAALLGERTNAVEVALHRALDRLRNILEAPARASSEAAPTHVRATRPRDEPQA